MGPVFFMCFFLTVQSQATLRTCLNWICSNFILNSLFSDPPLLEKEYDLRSYRTVS